MEYKIYPQIIHPIVNFDEEELEYVRKYLEYEEHQDLADTLIDRECRLVPDGLVGIEKIDYSQCRCKFINKYDQDGGRAIYNTIFNLNTIQKFIDSEKRKKSVQDMLDESRHRIVGTLDESMKANNDWYLLYVALGKDDSDINFPRAFYGYSENYIYFLEKIVRHQDSPDYRITFIPLLKARDRVVSIFGNNI